MKKINNKWGITAMILGILAIVLFLAPYIGLPLGVLAIIFSSLQKPSTGASKTGLITGIIGVVICFIILVFMLLFWSYIASFV